MFINRDLFVSIEDCIITQFEFGEALSDIEYVIGSIPAERRVLPYIVQPACNYIIRYEANLVSATNELVSLPDAIELIEDQNGDLIVLVDSSDENEIGEYIVQIRGVIDEGP